MFHSLKLSLTDLLGEEYIASVIRGAAAFGFEDEASLKAIADEKVECYPSSMQEKQNALLPMVGKPFSAPLSKTVSGAATNAFSHAFSAAASPVTGFGSFRIGEDGKLYLIGKSEHYHVPLGHRFPGYKLIDNARKLGILNATHNNTRGYITRLAEMRLVASANGLDWSDEKGLEAVLASKEPKVLNRVINLETGSLACEAGVKMMLSRFYKLDDTFESPKYAGKVPVIFVMGDKDGGIEGNYHGTTVVTQTFRGLWPEIREKVEEEELYKVVPVKINDIEAFKEALKTYNTGKYKTAGFMHEIVLMNYGAIRLTKEFLNEAYALCKEYDTPTMVDEIQTGMWYDSLFLFRIYGLQPDFVIVGKGFPGGEYPASKIITTAEMDTLNQFGALVTNGQEELASLAYLITMRFMLENGKIVAENGERFQNGLREVMKKHPDVILNIEGYQYLSSLHFRSVDAAAAFASEMKKRAIDASAQIYKAHCLPAVLMKPPIISTPETVDFIVGVIDEILTK